MAAKLRRARVATLAALIVAALQAGLLFRTALDKSDTIDESHYLASAVRLWTEANLNASCAEPALPKWGFGLALRIADPELFQTGATRGRDPLWSRRPEEVRRNLLAGRSATISLTVVAGLFLWRACWVFGPAAAFIAHILWCLSPMVLAHGSLATIDAWAASWLCVVIWGVVRFVRDPCWPRALVVGAALGLAAACKVTTLGGVPVAVGVGGVALWQRKRTDCTWRTFVAPGLALAAGWLGALWSVYLFQVGSLDLSCPCGRETTLPSWEIGPLPAPAWFGGAVLQWLHGRGGHLNYLFGESSHQGWWWFYLAAILLKTPLGAQGLGVLRVGAWLRRFPAREALWIDTALLAYPTLLLVVMSLGNAQSGLKYLLPAFPFVHVFLARTLADARRSFGAAGVAAVAACAVAGAAESLAVHPHHLMFFNAWAGGPERGPRYLIVGDDWGQDQRRLGEWQKQNRPYRLYYTRYSGRPEYWGITYETPPCEPRPGYYALQAVEVHRPKRIRAGCLDWLTVEPPDARLGYSIYLYQVNKPRIERLMQKRHTEEPFWRSGEPVGPG